MSDRKLHVIRHGQGLTECCGRVPSELPVSDQITAIPEQHTLPPGVLCGGPQTVAIAMVHCGDMEQHAVSFNQGYAEAVAQGIGGPESRLWTIQKIETILGPLKSLRPTLAAQIADALLTDTDMRSALVFPDSLINALHQVQTRDDGEWAWAEDLAAEVSKLIKCTCPPAQVVGSGGDLIDQDADPCCRQHGTVGPLMCRNCDGDTLVCAACGVAYDANA